ncbi:MAG TPA: alpha-amylase family glycosyl hydrolase [Steroidobacteraceae bacterium]|nr:alpha-amylase family glycosyl hydrolase [Steroidobacteraceae bacterium]
MSTGSGEAWTFDLPVQGEIEDLTCDSVRVGSRAAEVTAQQVGRNFFATLPLHEGENVVRASCRRGGKVVALSPAHIREEKLHAAPTARVRVRVEDQTIRLNAGASSPFDVPLTQFRWASTPSNPAPLMQSGGKGLDASDQRTLELATPQHDGNYIVALEVRDALNRKDSAEAMFEVRNGVAAEIDPRERPSWVDSLILYGAAPYEFAPPTFSGIRDRLDEIAALGANAVWISPATRAAPDDFGYAVMDHLAIDSRFGGDEGFRDLVTTAHRLGLRVLVDFVPNHLASVHPYVLDAEKQGKRSVYYDWFDRDASGAISHYFEWQHLSNLNYDNPQVRNYMTAAFRRMVQEFDVDGFRVDAAWAISRRAPEFWNELRRELQRIKPDVFLLAEASARDPHYFINGFDAAYDWTYQLGEWSWKDLFDADGSPNLAALRADLQATAHDNRHLALHFINNNDSADRFATQHGEPLAKLAATLLFTIPGIPLIYNGDEIAASFQPYDEGPPLNWRDDDPLVQHYRRLSALRLGNSALVSGDLQLLRSNHDNELLAFTRTNAQQRILVLLNFSDREIDVRPRDSELATWKSFAHSRDLLSGQEIEENEGALTFRVPATAARILLTHQEANATQSSQR